jgi:hypothetical protein
MYRVLTLSRRDLGAVYTIYTPVYKGDNSRPLRTELFKNRALFKREIIITYILV